MSVNPFPARRHCWLWGAFLHLRALPWHSQDKELLGLLSISLLPLERASPCSENDVSFGVRIWEMVSWKGQGEEEKESQVTLQF